MKVDGTKIQEMLKTEKTLDALTTSADESADDINKTDSENISHNVIQTKVEKPFKDVAASKADIMQAAQNEELNKVNANLNYASDTMTTKDAKKVMDEGYSLNDTDVETLVSVVDEIKIKMAAAGADVDTYGISLEEIKKVEGSTLRANQIAEKMQENDIPVTDSNLSEAVNVDENAASLEPLTDDAKKYMINNEMAPTIDNLYKAEHSATAESGNTTVVTDEMWNDIKSQVEKIIKKSGLEVNEKTISNSKWLIENQIELTEDTLNAKVNLDELELPADRDTVTNAIVKALFEGKRPADAVLGATDDYYKRAKEAISVISKTTDSDLKELIRQNKEITIENLKNLKNVQESTENTLVVTGTSIGENNKDSSQSFSDENNNTESNYNGKQDEALKMLTAKRKLAEVSLMMTVEASVRMMRMGIEVETQSLANLVDDLKNQEQNYYESLFKTAQLEPTEENIDLYKDTITKGDEIKTVPDYILGQKPFINKITSEISELNLNSISGEGMKLKEALDEAGTKYETLMTSPRADMGDSINKAFQNVDAIIEDMGLELNDENKKAVRILAYNSTEINQENILTVKEADTKVNNLINNLKPSAVMQLIKQGINPLNMNIDELNMKLDEINTDEDFEDTDKYSEFLWKLEQNGKITDEERESFIGIYRLMRSVEKTDGAVVGALINQNAGITMKNLMTAVRNSKGKGMDYSVDDDFGSVVSMKGKTSDITVQIETAFDNQGTGTNQNDTSNNQSPQNETSMDRQVKEKEVSYNNNLVKIILNNISPEALSQIASDYDINEMTLEQLTQEMLKSQTDDELDKKYLREQVQQFEQTANSDDNVVRLLVENDIPVKAYNIMAANNMLNKRNNWYNQILKANSEDTDLEDIKQGIIDKFSESLETPEEMAQAMEDLANVAENVMRGMVESKDVTSINLKEVKLLHKELSIMSKLSKEENYTIPVLVGNSLTGISLKIVRGENEKGRLNITFETDEGGKVGAEIIMKENSISGLIVAQDEDTLKTLSENSDFLKEQLTESDDEKVDLNYAISDNLDLSRFQALSVKNEVNVKKNEADNESGYKVQTKRLYEAAKKFLCYVTDSFDRYSNQNI